MVICTIILTIISINAQIISSSAIIITHSLLWSIVFGTIITTTLLSVSIIEMICLLLLFSFLRRYQYGVTVTFCYFYHFLCNSRWITRRNTIECKICGTCFLLTTALAADDNSWRTIAKSPFRFSFFQNFDFAMQKTREKLVSLLRTFKHHEFPVDSQLIIAG